MPTLRERIDDVFRATGQVVFEDWFDNLRTTLDLMAFYGAVTYDGYIRKDLIPLEDGDIVIGIPGHLLKDIYSEYLHVTDEATINVLNVEDIFAEDIESDTGIIDVLEVKRASVYDLDAEYCSFKEVSSEDIIARNIDAEDIEVSDKLTSNIIETNEIDGELGYFSENVYVQGKRVIKDEDPLYIASFFDKAVEQIKETIIDALEDLNVPPATKLIGKIVGYEAPAFVDILPVDAIAEFDGIIRLKMISSYDVFAYLKWTPYGESYPIIGLLNEGDIVKANTIKEMETTVSKYDKVNVRVVPGAKVTLFVYNMNIN